MNPTSKKLISLFLVFSLMMLPTSLYAQKRGAKLIITKKDWQQIEGELITVKPDSLLLLDTEGKDASVDIADIKVIRIVKKSKALLGAGGGLFTAGVVGALAGLGSHRPFLERVAYGLITYGVYLAIPAVIIGAVAGAVIGTDKTIRIDGMTDSEIQETMDKLRKKARIRDYK